MEEFLQIVRDFLVCAREKFAVGSASYLDERMSAETVFKTVMRAHHYPEELLPKATAEAITAYFEWWINYHIAIYQEETGKDDLLDSPGDDIYVIDMAAIFAHRITLPENEAFCDSIGVQYHYEQLHMVRWFSSQITHGGGHYSRSTSNISSRATYNRLLNANSLLWIGTILGADRGKLRQAAEEAGQGKARATAAACSVVRKYIPFDDLLPLARKWLQELDEIDGSVPPDEDDKHPAIAEEESSAWEAEPPQREESPLTAEEPLSTQDPVLTDHDSTSQYSREMTAMSETSTTSRDEIKRKLREQFDGRIVRKDLTKKIKEGANVPTYVLEFLLGQYCSSDDDAIIERGIERVKRILADNFVRPDENQKVLSLMRRAGSYSIIDMVTVSLDLKHDQYLASFSNLGLKDIPISEEYPEKYDRLLCGGIWCFISLDYASDAPGLLDQFMDPEQLKEEKQKRQQKKAVCPITITNLKPIQMPHVDMNELKRGRKAFTKEEWMDVLLRSIGMEPDSLKPREKWLLLARMLPLVENNFNLCELGPCSTGKSHLYKEISPNSILVSGGQTTVANLFYNMSAKAVGLVGLWDVVAFDEVAGIKFKDKDGIQIMKDYMASGSFARGKEEKAASASMVFVGNINQSVDVLLKTSSLFAPFPPEMGTDTAFLDRMHCYIPGWEIPKFRPDHFTNDYGFITDYLAEFLRELRKEQYNHALRQVDHDSIRGPMLPVRLDFLDVQKANKTQKSVRCPIRHHIWHDDNH